MRWPWSKPDAYVDVEDRHRKRLIEEATFQQQVQYDSAIVKVNGRQLRLVSRRWKWQREDR